ncbi:DUF58 domain-containing protein [Novosphingobium terrae]|uniref:DUF58 domain-containing protein n=1 Tax=Novosphingobium terrae TaxID=2726189 RepID=UPI0019812584|nr:DUF58 domain-containing protein [Novosphingobium terrae]
MRWLSALLARLKPDQAPVPTARAVLALVALAGLGLAIAVMVPDGWIVGPSLGVVLLVLVLVDAALAGRLGEISLNAPPEVEVGAKANLTIRAALSPRASQVEAALGLDPRLAPGGVLAMPLTRDGETHEGHAAIAPSRRGPGQIDTVWLRWQGPLGLGARQARRAFDRPLRVNPNLALLRSRGVQATLRDADIGLVARRIHGDGTMFEALSDYHPGMDRRRIDWKASARHAHLYAKEYEAERNNRIVFALDCGQAMCEPVAGLARLDRAISVALAAGWVALKGGDLVSLFGFASRVLLSTPFVTDASGFGRLQSAAALLDYESREPNFTLALATLAQQLQRRSLIVVFSDFTDPTSAQLMVESIGRLVARHRVIFVTMLDEELEALARAEPEATQDVALAVGAGQLLRQRALVTARLRQLGVDVIEAPHDKLGLSLIDAYLSIRQAGGIG